MTTALSTIHHPAAVPTLTAPQIKAQVNLVQQVMKAVMKRETHYGVIPGTQKPTLLKAGAEVLLTTFRIAVEPEVEDLSTPDEIRYRVRALGRHQGTGIVVGIGIGECSSSEEKYRWRDAVCDEEFDLTDEDRRRVKYAKAKGGGHYTRRQIRTVPADLANTVLKMAKKRAQIDLTLTATAASDIFTQDLEEGDGPQGYGDEGQHQAPQRPQASAPSSGGYGIASEKQQKLIRAKLSNAGISEADFCSTMGITSITELPFGKVNDGLAWIAKAGAPPAE
jgi:hypothetical protein